MNEKPNTTAGDDLGKSAGGSGEKILQEAKAAVGHMAKDARGQVERRVESQKERAADTIGTVAEAIRAAGEPLADMGPLPELTGRAADEIERVAAYVQSRSVGDLVKEVERYARREPAIFMTAAFGLGLLAGRFLKSSPRASAHPEIQDEPFARIGSDFEGGIGARGRYDSTRREPSYVGARGGWAPEHTTSASPSVGHVDRTMNSGLEGAGNQGTGPGSPYDTAGSSVSAKAPQGTFVPKTPGTLVSTPMPSTVSASTASTPGASTAASTPPASSRSANGSGDGGSVRRP